VTSVTATPTGLTIGSPSVSSSTQVICSISGGTVGVYQIECIIVTSGGAILACEGQLTVLP
jgi:hypothetical protein